MSFSVGAEGRAATAGLAVGATGVPQPVCQAGPAESNYAAHPTIIRNIKISLLDKRRAARASHAAKLISIDLLYTALDQFDVGLIGLSLVLRSPQRQHDQTFWAGRNKDEFHNGWAVLVGAVHCQHFCLQAANNDSRIQRAFPLR